jgi:hypothetical protein
MECLPDSFNDAATVTHSYIEAANIPARIPMTVSKAIHIAPKAKRGYPPGAKDMHPQQKRAATVIPATTSSARDQDNPENQSNACILEKLGPEMLPN